MLTNKGGKMMPLVLSEPGETQIIKRIDLGFNVGGEVSVVSMLGGNLIVKVKESRVAVSEELARKIMV